MTLLSPASLKTQILHPNASPLGSPRGSYPHVSKGCCRRMRMIAMNCVGLPGTAKCSAQRGVLRHGQVRVRGFKCGEQNQGTKPGKNQEEVRQYVPQSNCFACENVKKIPPGARVEERKNVTRVTLEEMERTETCGRTARTSQTPGQTGESWLPALVYVSPTKHVKGIFLLARKEFTLLF